MLVIIAMAGFITPASWLEEVWQRWRISRELRHAQSDYQPSGHSLPSTPEMLQALQELTEQGVPLANVDYSDLIPPK
jgi:hypothetical protein